MADLDTVHKITEKIKSGMTQMIGTSGTVTTLGGLHLGLERYDRAMVDAHARRLRDGQCFGHDSPHRKTGAIERGAERFARGVGRGCGDV